MRFQKLVLLLAVFCLMTSGALAATPTAEALAEAAQNPLATMVTLPLQTNYNSGVNTYDENGVYDRTFFNLNVQPVVPMVGEKWNVIARTIIPINSLPLGEYDSIFGIGDTMMTFFVSPAKAGSVIWGLGPIIGLPTASNPQALGTQKWGLGPSGVIFISAAKWTFGGVVSNVWSVAGNKDRASYSNFTFQWFINYNIGGGWAVGTVPIVTANWKAESGEQWTVPWGLQVSKVSKIGQQPVNILLGYYYNSEHPTDGAERQVRFQINFMFPTRGN